MRLEKPIFILSSPRAGSSLLLETLSRSPSVFTLGMESQELFERIPKISSVQRGFTSNRLTAEDADDETAAALRENFTGMLRDRQGFFPAPGVDSIRMLEKSPKYSLRVPFLNAVFPDARFIYLYREPRGAISSIMEAWASGRFVTYPNLPGWTGAPWSLLLIPEWQKLIGATPAAIAAAQWTSANAHILDDLAQLPPDRWCGVSYDDFLDDPQAHVRRLCQFADIAWDEPLGTPLPLARHTLTAPDPKKWEKHAIALGSVLPSCEAIAERTRRAFAQNAQIHPPAEPTLHRGRGATVSAPVAAAATGAPQSPAESPLRSVHTTNLVEILQKLGISILVSTYQAGKLITVRVVNGTLNTHFNNFPSPMGLACDGQRLAIGTALQVWEFQNQPDVGRRIDPSGRTDACFLPRASHITGDIRIHEIAWAGDELWIVNTRFSCLCTVDKCHSFVPRWRPPFISGYAPEDRCHLNGFCLRDGQPRYATALGHSDVAHGWREKKATGGILMEIPSGKVLASGLSMPHSPRWYDNKLWVLESGAGKLCTVDLNSGRVDTIATVPGFTRGLDFVGPFAVIGLSQVRESNVFSGLPITKQKERYCGVWIVDTRNGQTVGFIRWEGAVQEIFAVQVLPGLHCPEVINDNDALIGNSFILPDNALKDVQLPKA